MKENSETIVANMKINMQFCTIYEQFCVMSWIFLILWYNL